MWFLYLEKAINIDLEEDIVLKFLKKRAHLYLFLLSFFSSSCYLTGKGRGVEGAIVGLLVGRQFEAYCSLSSACSTSSLVDLGSSPGCLLVAGLLWVRHHRTLLLLACRGCAGVCACSSSKHRLSK